MAAANKDPAVGYIFPNQVEAQMKVLNEAYMPAGINFTVIDTTYTVNADWFNKAGPTNSFQTEMKKALRRGGAADLNVYTVG
ncbi:hypothetical protein C0992_003422 [Termitomyces sp. T32_za158]|nr:hypothetical protein C0992_003422 [Termitomyces sp. T32_za158]